MPSARAKGAWFSISAEGDPMSKPIPDNITYPDVVRGWWAEARFHPDFYCVFSQSGFRATLIDEKGRELYLPPDASDEALGGAVLKAMAVRRWLLPKPTPGHIYHPDIEFDEESANFINAYKLELEWDKRARTRYRLKHKKDLYVPMKRCNITRKEGEITIRCHVHYPEKQYGDCWGFDTNELAPYVILPDAATAEEIGAGVKLAFSRCRDLPG